MIRSITFDGEPSCFALAPLGSTPVSRTVAIRRYRSGEADPLPGPGVAQTFRAVDIDAWLVPALALIDLALSPRYAGPADAVAGGRAPLARLIAARESLVERIASRTTPLVAGRGDLPAATAALRRILDFNLSEAWAATTVVQLPTTVDAAVPDGAASVVEITVAVSEDGTPADVQVAPTELDLERAKGTLDLVVQVAEPGRRRRRTLDLVLDVAEPDPPSPPAPPTAGAAPGPWTTRVETPVPLRAQPPSPAAVAQTAETTASGEAATLHDAVAWTFAATFEVPAADQDELELRVAWNAAASSEAAAAGPAADGPTGPFVALAELTGNHDAIRADLERLPRPDPDPDPENPDGDDDPNSDPAPDPVPAPAVRQAAVDAPAEALTDEAPTDGQRAVSALTALAALTEQLASGWGPVGPEAVDASPLASDGTATLRLATAWGPEPGGAAAFVLRRETETWGPEGRRPRVGYVADGHLVVLDPEPAGGDAATLRYVPDPRHPPAVAGQRRTVVLAYPDLSAVVTQRMRTSARGIRNAGLVPDAEAPSAFVLQTAEAAFQRPVVPALVADDPIAIGSGPGAGFAPALATALRTLLGPGPYDGRPWVSLAVGISTRIGPDGPDTTQPILLVPPQAYDDTLPGQVGTVVTDWRTQQEPEPSSASTLTTELRLLAGAPTTDPPLAVLRRLDYRLTP